MFYLIFTGKDKITGSLDPIISQHELTIELSKHKKSFVNLNTLVLIENNFFSELFREVGQPEKKIQLSEEELMIIKSKVNFCFNNPFCRGNLYELKVLPNCSFDFVVYS